MSVLTQDRASLDDNRKQHSSFGNWYTMTNERLCLLILTDLDFSDSGALQFLKELSEEIERNHSAMLREGDCSIDRGTLEDSIRDL